MRRVLLPLLALLLVSTEAPAAPVRGTVQQAIDRMKSAFARRDHAAEWGTLSPALKLRISKRAGRNVDVGDYIAARNAHSKDPRVRELRQWMHTAHPERIEYRNDGTARVTIRFGAPLLLGKSVTVTMIHHEHWELWIKGESQPYWGFMNSKTIRVFRHPKTNVHTVQTLDEEGEVTWQKKFPAEKVQAYRTVTRWYFHDFGHYEAEFLKGADRSDDRVPPAKPKARATSRRKQK